MPLLGHCTNSRHNTNMWNNQPRLSNVCQYTSVLQTIPEHNIWVYYIMTKCMMIISSHVTSCTERKTLLKQYFTCHYLSLSGHVLFHFYWRCFKLYFVMLYYNSRIHIWFIFAVKQVQDHSMFWDQYLSQSHARRCAELCLGSDGDRLHFEGMPWNQ